MPELPEVQTVVNFLALHILNREIASIEVYREKNILTGVASFTSSLIGDSFIKMGRKGKFLLFYTAKQNLLVGHLRMEGKFYFYEAEYPRQKHDILKILFKGGTSLVYNDVRKFGTLELYPLDVAFEKASFAKLGPDPFEADPSVFYQRIHGSNKPIKELLMDQTIVSGIGNIYADETLFASSIHPLTKGSSLSESDCLALLNNSKAIMQEAIDLGGSTIRSYHPALGMNGAMQNALLVYGHRYEKCPKCGLPLRTIFVNGRSSTYCPKCQRRKDGPTVLAICGPIHSGKSYASTYLARKGYPLFDCDDECKKLYKEQKVIQGVAKILGKEVLNSCGLSLSKMRVKMKDPTKRKAVTDYLYPLLRKKALLFLAKCKKDLAIMEIPLFLGSGLEDLVDYLLLVDASLEIRIKRLQEEGKDVDALIKINSLYPLNRTKKEASFILTNEGSLEDFEKALDNLPILS